ncbi:MAG: hypothetical protein HXY28_15195 [Hydrogenophilaceae bacterium]|jgi:hypothetical protein|nr:hypothetical protein [Hydrogenophilaceae bacterium]
MTRNAWRCTRFLPDDTIRLRMAWKVPSKSKFVDGTRVGDLRHAGVRFLLARGRIDVVRDGKVLRPTPTKKMQREAAERRRRAQPARTAPFDPWARECIAASTAIRNSPRRTSRTASADRVWPSAMHSDTPPRGQLISANVG